MRTANPDLRNRRRHEILKAAEQCFLKHGFHQTSMQNIAAASGLSMGLLYRYFANKEALIEAVAQQDQETALLTIAALPVEGDVIAAWAALVFDMATTASSADYASLASEILAEANRSPKILQALRSNDSALTSAIVEKLAEQQLRGAIRPSGNLVIAAQALLLLFEGLTMRRFMAAPAIQQNGKALLARIISSVLIDVQS